MFDVTIPNAGDEAAAIAWRQVGDQLHADD
jgi:hypothetical protein